MADFQFPSNLGDNALPMISFLARGGRDLVDIGSVTLPLPRDFSVSDSASFNTFDLGIMSAVGIAAVNAAGESGVFSAEGLENIINAFADASSMTANDMKTNNIKQAAMRALFGADVVGFQTRKTARPNTQTAFNNMGKRSFSFSFRLVPENGVDNTTILDIQRFFRRNMYAKENGQLNLEYPAIWTISIHGGNNHYPQIAQAYLSGFSTTWNSSQGLPYHDGSPSDASFSLTFEEARVLTADDIDALASGDLASVRRAQQRNTADFISEIIFNDAKPLSESQQPTSPRNRGGR